MSSHEAVPRSGTGAPGRIEVVAGHERRRRYSDEDAASLKVEPGELAKLIGRFQTVDGARPAARPASAQPARHAARRHPAAAAYV